jgi:hypothetical protein
VSEDDDGDDVTTSSQTSPSAAPTVPQSVSDELASKNGNGGNASPNLADLLSINDFFSPAEVEKISSVVEEGKTTCKPVYLFLQVASALDDVTSSKAQTGGVGAAGSMPLPMSVPYKVAELVHGADAPKVYSLVNNLLAAA